MHLYVLFLNGKRLEIGAEPSQTIQEFIKFLLLRDKELKDKQFFLLYEKQKRILTKDEYNKTLQQLGIDKEDYFSIVLDDKPYQQNKVEDKVIIQPPTTNLPSQSQFANPYLAQQGQFSNFQAQLPPQQNIAQPPQQQLQFNRQSFQPAYGQNPIQENQYNIQPQFQNQQIPTPQQINPLQNQVDELKRVNQELQAQITNLTQQLQQAEQKIQKQKFFIMQRLQDE